MALKEIELIFGGLLDTIHMGYLVIGRLIDNHFPKCIRNISVSNNLTSNF